MEALWKRVDEYFSAALMAGDSEPEALLAANARAGLPPIDVSRLQGKFLDLLVRISGAKRILEIGTLGGYSTFWFARAVGAAGHVMTLETDPEHARVARANLEAAGVMGRVSLRVGKAIDTLPKLAEERSGPFDLVFIDADKASNPDYLWWGLQLSRPGTVIIADNVVREGRVLEARSPDPDIQGTRRFVEMIEAEPRLSATAIQTVGSKGYDGFVLALVLDAEA